MPLPKEQQQIISKLYDIATKDPDLRSLYSAVTWEGKNDQNQSLIKQHTPLTKQQVLDYSNQHMLPATYHIIMLGLAKTRAQGIAHNLSDKVIGRKLDALLHMELGQFMHEVLHANATLSQTVALLPQGKHIDLTRPVAHYIANIGCNVMLWGEDPIYKNSTSTSPSAYLERFHIFQQERAGKGRGLFGGLADDREDYINPQNASIQSLNGKTLSHVVNKGMTREFKEEMDDAGVKNLQQKTHQQSSAQTTQQPWYNRVWSALITPFTYVLEGVKKIFNAIGALFNQAPFNTSSNITNKNTSELKTGNDKEQCVSQFITQTSKDIQTQKYTPTVQQYPDYSFIPGTWGTKASGGFFYLENYKSHPFAAFAYCNAMQSDFNTLKAVEQQLASSKKEGEVRSAFTSPLTEVLDNCYTTQKQGRDGFCYIHEAVGAWDLAYERIKEGIASNKLHGYKNADEAIIALAQERKAQSPHISFDDFKLSRTTHIPENTFSILKEILTKQKEQTVNIPQHKINHNNTVLQNNITTQQHRR